MKRLEIYLGRAFVVASIYLSAVVVGGFFVLRIFDVADYAPPRPAVLFLKATFVLAVNLAVASAIILPGLKLIHRQKIRSPSDIAATTLLIGLILILLHELYVKLRTCPYVGRDEWYCQVENDSYVGMIVLASFLSSLVGCAVWLGRKLTKKK